MAEPTIKELRARTGMSQSQFAKQFGISVRSVQAWEQGTSRPRRGTITMIEQIIQHAKLAAPEGMLSVKQLAEECNCSTVNIRSHLNNHASHLKGHISYDYKVLLMDEFAQNFIRDLVRKNSAKHSTELNSNPESSTES